MSDDIQRRNKVLGTLHWEAAQRAPREALQELARQVVQGSNAFLVDRGERVSVIVDGMIVGSVHHASDLREMLLKAIDCMAEEKPSLTVMGTTTAKDDLMIEAIAQGLASGEAARTKKAVEEVASRDPGYTPPSPTEIDDMMRVLSQEPGGVTDYEHRYRTDPEFRCGVDAVVVAKTGRTLQSISERTAA